MIDRKDCQCGCHRGEDIMHFAPCCIDDATSRWPFEEPPKNPPTSITVGGGPPWLGEDDEQS